MKEAIGDEAQALAIEGARDLRQDPSEDEFEGDIADGIGEALAVDGNDVGVLESSESLGFEVEAVGSAQDVCAGGSELDGNETTEEEITSEVDPSHATVADGANDVKTIEVMRRFPSR
jgi:hypothetical protein